MKPGLTNNQLKIIALITMTIDHIGVVMPQYPILRIIGRLSLPIYAYMIAEGCTHTRDIWRYFRSVAVLAVLCQIVQYLVTGSLHMGILVTFSLSILIAGLLKERLWLPGVLALTAAWFICSILPGMLRGTNFRVDYGFIGVLIPVVLYLVPGKWLKLAAMAGMLCLLAYTGHKVQWYALLSLPLLLIYNQQRGSKNLKGLFYWYYPAHIAVIYGLSVLLK